MGGGGGEGGGCRKEKGGRVIEHLDQAIPALVKPINSVLRQNFCHLQSKELRPKEKKKKDQKRDDLVHIYIVFPWVGIHAGSMSLGKCICAVCM